MSTNEIEEFVNGALISWVSTELLEKYAVVELRLRNLCGVMILCDRNINF